MHVPDSLVPKGRREQAGRGARGEQSPEHRPGPGELQPPLRPAFLGEREGQQQKPLRPEMPCDWVTFLKQGKDTFT